MSLLFDGVNDEVVSQTDGVGAGEFTFGNDISVVAWINPTGAGENNFGFIACHGLTTTPRWAFGLNNTSGRLRLLMNGTTDANFISANDGWTTSLWTHAGVVFSIDDIFAGSGDTEPTFYRNGAALGALTTSTAPTGSADADDANLRIGNDSTGARTFDGLIAEVAVFMRRLTANEFAAAYVLGPLALGPEWYSPLDIFTSGTNRTPNYGRGRHVIHDGDLNVDGIATGAVLAQAPPFRVGGRRG